MAIKYASCSLFTGARAASSLKTAIISDGGLTQVIG